MNPSSTGTSTSTGHPPPSAIDPQPSTCSLPCRVSRPLHQKLLPTTPEPTSESRPTATTATTASTASTASRTLFHFYLRLRLSTSPHPIKDPRQITDSGGRN